MIMMIQIEMGPGFDGVVADLGAMGQRVLDAASEGLATGVQDTAAHIQANYLTGQALKSRTGMLRKALDGWMEGKFDGVVGVRENSGVDQYKWLLGDEQKTITPKRGKFLAIPIGEALTPSGMVKAKFASPRLVDDGFFIQSKGKLLFGYKRGKRGKFRPLFVMVKSVLVQGSGALYDGVMDKVDDMGAAMEDAIGKAVEN